MKTAIIHEWLVNYAGSERVLEQIVKLYPQADLFCQVDFLPDKERGFILNKKTETSLIQNLPFAKKKYRNYLPLMPFAVRRFDVSAYDVIISNSHSVAKGVKKTPGQIQICYCHTPMRYAWDLREQYLNESGLNSGIKGALTNSILNRLRNWDYRTAQQVDYFIANSHYIKDRIRRAYGREAKVIYPPVDVDSFHLNEKKDNYFLAVSRMVPYKKMDLIVEAFSEIGLPLIVIGDGPDFEKVKNKAKKNIGFLGYQKDNVLKEYMQKARAFIFAAEEDFGIVPVEAQACGTPVIAFGKGGVTETVIPVKNSGFGVQGSAFRDLTSPTGLFFYEQTPTALIDALKSFEAVEDKFDPHEIRKNAERFSIERFEKEFKDFVNERINEFL
ncbi:MAG TPA: glycosyltransferase family 4 protein [Nitrospirae bacterium]|nr:glycosyltransferase family 4 protein [Nitrospirota bacterium]HDZ02695.1 glycosyltransferase family 4 protein [Nitrospirota bacterium]